MRFRPVEVGSQEFGCLACYSSVISCNSPVVVPVLFPDHFSAVQVLCILLGWLRRLFTVFAGTGFGRNVELRHKTVAARDERHRLGVVIKLSHLQREGVRASFP